MSNLVQLEKSKAIATVTLNRPEKRNAINAEMCDAIREAFDDIEADPDIKASILTGNGPAFSAGMDLAEFLDGRSDKILFGRHGFAGFVKRQRSKPVIAAIEGAALAGGFEIALACDLICAGESAVFSLPEPRLGLVAGGGGAARLARLLPRHLANEIVLTARKFSAGQLQDWGLVNRVVFDGSAIQAAIEFAQSIIKGTPDSISASLELSRNVKSGLDGADWELNDLLLKDLVDCEATTSRVTAFLERN